MTIQEIKELAIHAAKGTAPTEFTVDQVDKALADGFRELAGSVNQFMKNRYDIYDIMITAADEVVPAKVIDAMGIFAEVQQVGQGQKAIFKRKIGKQRAKQFITQVGLSGVYESFRLDTETFEVSAKAIGGAVTIDFERMLDNAETMAEVMEVITEGLVDSLYVETQRALIAAASSQKIPAANKVVENSFDSAKMFKLCSTVGAYGNAVIFAAPEFVAGMGADAVVPVPTNGSYGGVYHPQDIDAIHNQGYINIFRGTPVIKMPQSFTDETNSKVVINPQYAYVLPTGKERVVKIALEGQTQINDFKNRDNSMEIHVYKKMGVAILNYNNWGVYQNTGIDATNWVDSVYGF
ncbi:MAG: hypothetical protein MR911_10640 [Spirochaetia bacterium]|nr:hypothetical protein [Spirochaetia bacterium]